MLIMQDLENMKTRHGLLQNLCAKDYINEYINVSLGFWVQKWIPSLLLIALFSLFPVEFGFSSCPEWCKY